MAPTELSRGPGRGPVSFILAFQPHTRQKGVLTGQIGGVREDGSAERIGA